MAWRLGIPAGLIVGGIVAIAWAATHGGATAYILLIVPVVTGGSWLFLFGVGLILLGMFAWPLATYGGPTESTERSHPGGSGSEMGGVVLIGPIPIFFGAWRNLPHRTRWLVAIAGVVVFVAAIGAVLYAVR